MIVQEAATERLRQCAATVNFPALGQPLRSMSMDFPVGWNETGRPTDERLDADRTARASWRSKS
jgi:hypothetical protein